MSEPRLRRVPLDLALGEREVFSEAELRRLRARARAGAFVWDLHAAAIDRWSDQAENGPVSGVGQELIERLRMPLITETDQLAATLNGLVVAHLREVRPEMSPVTRRRLAYRAAQVGFLRLAPDLRETYAEIAARAEVGASSVRPLKSDFALFLDAYISAFQRGVLPPRIPPEALRGSSCR